MRFAVLALLFVAACSSSSSPADPPSGDCCTLVTGAYLPASACDPSATLGDVTSGHWIAIDEQGKTTCAPASACETEAGGEVLCQCFSAGFVSGTVAKCH